MSSTKLAPKRLKVFNISREDFPDNFDEYKGVTDYYIHAQTEQFNQNPKLTDFWIISDMVTGLPYYLEKPDDQILKLFDQRIQSILSNLKIGDTLIDQQFISRLNELTKSLPISTKLTSKEVELAGLPWGVMPVAKTSKRNFSIQLDESDKMAKVSRGSIGIIFTAMFQAGFTRDEKLNYYYPILTMVTGHSQGGWNKAIAKDLQTLIKRGDDISKLDLENVKSFLSDTLKTIEAIDAALPKSRRKK